MPTRAQSIGSLTLGLLLSVSLAIPVLRADERAGGSGAPTQMAQTQQPTEPEKPAATPQEPPTPEAPTAAFGPTWRSSSTGRQIPDPTGTRFFRPAASGGTGVTAW
jgi:hypothetical protein